MDEYVVEMRHITKRFPGIVANDDVSISIRKGEVYALLGENGAGKSTLMSMLFGMYEPDKGEIIVNGKPVVFHSSNDAAACNIGMVHQHFKLVDNYTIAENIVLGMEPVKKKFGFLPWVDMREVNKEIQELSQKYHLEVNPTDKIEDVPVSVRQRVEILKMLYRKAEIMIFDEPTAVLTPQEIEYLLEIIDGLRKDGKTVILITHKIEEIKKIADRCAILLRGKLVDILDVKTASVQEMANMMVGREVDFNPYKSPANFGKTILEVDHLTVKNENNFEVVKDVSFSIREGEIFAIAGVSGNGQTEIADAVAGMMKAASGTITLDGKDVTLIANGMMVQMALEAAKILENEGISARVINMATIKPIDAEIIIKAAKETGAIVTAEEHNVIGGLGSAVAEVLCETCPVPLKRVGTQDVFGQSGKPAELFSLYGLTKENIVENVKEVLKLK